MATGLSGFVLAAILSSFVFMGRSTLGIANYSAMNTESRHGLEVFGRDVRSAYDIEPGFSATEFTILLHDVGRVTYLHLPTHPDRPLVRRDSSGDRAIMTGVEELNFRYYDLRAEQASVPVRVKQLQLQLKLVRHAASLENTEKVVSARFILRNKKVSN